MKNIHPYIKYPTCAAEFATRMAATSRVASCLMITQPSIIPPPWHGALYTEATPGPVTLIVTRDMIVSVLQWK